MRILFTFAGLRGHLEPLVPIDRANEERLMREAFIGRIGRERAGRLPGLFADFEPDVVVRDETDFGAAVAAERLGLPCAALLVLAAGSLTRPQVVAEPLDALRAEHGLHGDTRRDDLVLSPFPPSLREPPAGTVSIRLSEIAPRDDDAGAVYVTLGTVFNLECGDLFVRVVAGLRELGRDVIVTVGDGIEPDELGPQAPHVHVERHVDQRLVLPRCAAVVSHAGSGSVLGALAHGLPSVLLPMGADQPEHAVGLLSELASS
jgi:UDP:flavonoid glycosyltransferase YjiC (YdhE family)